MDADQTHVCHYITTGPWIVQLSANYSRDPHCARPMGGQLSIPVILSANEKREGEIGYRWGGGYNTTSSVNSATVRAKVTQENQLFQIL